MRDVFDQFSETRTGGAFTFMTGIGGFLQEFLYGYSGLRFGARGVSLDPSLTGRMSGLVLHGLAWHGRRFTVAIGATDTTVTVDHGSSLPVRAGGTTYKVGHASPLRLQTRRPDRTPTEGPRALPGGDGVRLGAGCTAARRGGRQPGDRLATVRGARAARGRRWRVRRT